MTLPMSIKGAIFDLDGTVVENAYDWPKIRQELENAEVSILHYLCGLEEPERSRNGPSSSGMRPSRRPGPCFGRA
jgi:phosphoglycolate phosphatase-like HAD superfamily hydrolase